MILSQSTNILFKNSKRNVGTSNIPRGSSSYKKAQKQEDFLLKVILNQKVNNLLYGRYLFNTVITSHLVRGRSIPPRKIMVTFLSIYASTLKKTVYHHADLVEKTFTSICSGSFANIRTSPYLLGLVL